MSSDSPTRRTFLKGLVLVSVGFSLAPWTLRQVGGQSLPGSLRGGSNRVDSWLQILDDGRIRVLTGKLELGQGIQTVIAQVVAEELDTSPSQIEVKLAETDVTPDEGYTAGSRSVEQSAMAARHAAAAAAAILLRQAAVLLKVQAGDLMLEDGRVRLKQGAGGLSFSEALRGLQIHDEISGLVALKPKNEYKWVGKSVPRMEIEGMSRGEAMYVQDLRFADMVHARVIRPPRYGAKLIACDEADLRKNVTGVLALHVDGSFVGVVTEEEHQAEQAQIHLRAQARWTEGPPLLGAVDLKSHLKSLPSRTEIVERADLDFAEGSVRASYFRPYIMHGSAGPSCAVARFAEGRLQVWTHSQGVYPLRRSLQALLDLPAESVRVTGVPGSGCYGHNGADDAAAEAALLAVEYPGRHVRLQWSREDEHAWEPYGSAMIMELEASLDSDGMIAQWRYDLWSDTHSVRPGGNPANLLPAHYVENAYDPPTGGYFGGAYRNSKPDYSIPKLAITAHAFKGPLRCSALRGLGAHANVFAIESFMDELADRANRDPVEFRLAQLPDVRARNVLLAVREMVGEIPKLEHKGIGFAFSRYKNSAAYCAVAAEVVLRPGGSPRVARMWAAIDAGEIINPDGLRNQTEGGMIQSASWTMMEQVRFDASGIVSRDWSSYPIFGFSDVPQLEVQLIDRPDQPPLGAGEAAQGPAAAAIANALFRASGRRLRDMPLLGG